MPRIPLRTEPYDNPGRQQRHFKVKRDQALKQLQQASYISRSHFAILFVNARGNTECYGTPLFQPRLKSWFNEAVTAEAVELIKSQPRDAPPSSSHPTDEYDSQDPPSPELANDDLISTDLGEIAPSTELPSNFPADALQHLQSDGVSDDYYIGMFHKMQQAALKNIAKCWIKIIEPKKQSHHPYGKGDESKPHWWPQGIRHREPDHIRADERQDLLLAILRTRVIPMEELEVKTFQAIRDLDEKRTEMLRSLFVVAKEDERRRNRARGSTACEEDDRSLTSASISRGSSSFANDHSPLEYDDACANPFEVQMTVNRRRSDEVASVGSGNSGSFFSADEPKAHVHARLQSAGQVEFAVPSWSGMGQARPATKSSLSVGSDDPSTSQDPGLANSQMALYPTSVSLQPSLRHQPYPSPTGYPHPSLSPGHGPHRTPTKPWGVPSPQSAGIPPHDQQMAEPPYSSPNAYMVENDLASPQRPYPIDFRAGVAFHHMSPARRPSRPPSALRRPNRPSFLQMPQRHPLLGTGPLTMPGRFMVPREPQAVIATPEGHTPMTATPQSAMTEGYFDFTPHIGYSPHPAAQLHHGLAGGAPATVSGMLAFEFANLGPLDPAFDTYTSQAQQVPRSMTDAAQMQHPPTLHRASSHGSEAAAPTAPQVLQPAAEIYGENSDVQLGDVESSNVWDWMSIQSNDGATEKPIGTATL